MAAVCDTIKISQQLFSGEKMMRRICLTALLCVGLMLSACGGGAPTEVTVATEPDTEPATQPVVVTEPPTGPTAPEVTVPEPTEPILFSEDISFTGAYIADGERMPYAWFEPSSAEPDVKIPLIVFLHGRGECNTVESWFMSTGMPQVMQNWALEGFIAYVVCPQLYGAWNSGYWSCREAADYVAELVEYLSGQYPIDPERIYLVGFSSGGMGALYMAAEDPEFYAKLVVMSSSDVERAQLEKIQIPTVGASEMEITYNHFMKEAFPGAFGAASVRFYCVKHIEVPGAAFSDDRDGNNRSDLVEWLLEDAYEWALPEEE